MATQTWATVLDNSTDAGFRTWGSEVNAKLTAVGLTNTTDTGQINWTTVVRPAVNTAAGYEIWRFADSTLYMKIEYGAGSVVTTPQMWITVGTGSNGSGTLTGQTSTRAIFTFSAAPLSTVTNYTSRMCRLADAFSFVWKEGASTGTGGILVVGKTVDGTGAATTTGFGVLRGAAAAGISFQSVRIVSTATTFTDTTQMICIPGVVTSSTTAGGATQAYTIFMNVPDVQPFYWAAITINAEAPRDTSFTVAMVGSTTHTFASCGQPSVSGINTYATATYGLSMIYE